MQPIAIRYCTVDGSFSDTPAYVGDTSFMASFWRVLGERRLVVEITLPPALPAAGRHRRELSREAERAIRGALDLPADGYGTWNSASIVEAQRASTLRPKGSPNRASATCGASMSSSVDQCPQST